MFLFRKKSNRDKSFDDLREKCENFGPDNLKLFDEEYYKYTYSDVQASGMDAFVHFMEHGWKEGRSPSRYFNVSYYLDRYPDIREKSINPLLHFVHYGHEEAREINDSDLLEELRVVEHMFDADYYGVSYPDVIEAGLDPLLHYLQHGWREGRNPNADFDVSYYLTAYSDAKLSGRDPFFHYLSTGRARGYLPKRQPLSRTSLFEDESTEPYKGTVTGGVDEIDLQRGRVRGWVADRARPGASLAISIICDGTVVGRQKANLFRGDLKKAGFGEGRHGFVWRVPADIRDDRPHRIYFKLEDGELRLPTPYSRSILFPSSGEPAGNVDYIGETVVRGWAIDSSGETGCVEIWADDNLAGTIVADEMRADVRAAGFGNGDCGFSWTVPEFLRDGRRHRLVCKLGNFTLPMPDRYADGIIFKVTAGHIFSGVCPSQFQFLSAGPNGYPDYFDARGDADADIELLIVIIRSQKDWTDFDAAMAHYDGPEFHLVALVQSIAHIGKLNAAYKLCRHFYLAVYEGVDLPEMFCHCLKQLVWGDYAAVRLLNPSTESANESWAHDFAGRLHGVIGGSMRAANLTAPMAAFLSTALAHLGDRLRHDSFQVVTGSWLWLSALVVRSLAACNLKPEDFRMSEIDWYEALQVLVSYLAHDAGLKPATGLDVSSHMPADKRYIKTIAFMLPQFHPVPENNKWWGRGFTEWNNVIRGRPLFKHHDQPRLPRDLGFYDLRQTETLKHQARLAQSNGVYGFCYYYYWFDGKKVLNTPIEHMLKTPEIDHPFCVCWANENWSRNWDGQERHVLLKQSYSQESNLALIREFIALMKDPRYIRHHGKPVLLVYRIQIIPNWLETAAMWRDECRKAGLGEIHLCAIRFGLEPLHGQPQDFGIDAYVLFPPHETVRENLRSDVAHLHRHFGGEIFDYDAVWRGDLMRFEDGYEWPVHRGVMMGWDNTARRLTDARIFHGAAPLKLNAWLRGIVRQEMAHNPDDESLLFINAWNEWAEGTVLEPDMRFGDGYLRAVREATNGLAVKWSGTTRSASPGTATGSQTGMNGIFIPTQSATPKNIPEMHVGRGAYKASRPTLLLCAHISGHQLFGGERSFLDIVTVLSEMNVNLIVCLPSGNNRAYVQAMTDLTHRVYVFNYPQWHSRREADEFLTLNFADIIAAHNVTLVYANTIVLLEPLIAAKRMKRLRLVHSRELISLDAPLLERLQMKAEEVVEEIFKRSDYVIGNSQATAALFARHGRTFCVPNAVDIQAFDISNDLGDKIRFGIVSSNQPKKGVADFIEVARLCEGLSDRAEFVVIGPENDYTAQLRAGGSLPGNLKFVGYRETPVLAMAELNVLLNLSNFAESFGRTVAEAMAARRPVIAYEWGAVPELIVPNQTGFLAPYRDVKAVSKAVLDVCRLPDSISQMGAAAREHVTARYNYDALRKNMKKVIGNVLSKKAMAQLPWRGEDATPRRVTVVIPVFNAFDEVEACIKSVMAHTRKDVADILIINDASTDERIAPMLETHVQGEWVRIVHNTENLGYTRTINRGINLSGENDVVLLNSDAVVTPNWLAGLRAAAFSEPHVGTVTAMSDNAGAFSFPVMNQKNETPAWLSRDDFAIRVVQFSGKCQPVDVPTGSGFCMYLRRPLLNEIGLFDAEAFTRGYGEENDLCMRALAAGWKNLITPWSYVYHVRTASFKGEKEQLVKDGVQIVIERYPDYAARVKAAFSSDRMERLRVAAKSAF